MHILFYKDFRKQEDMEKDSFGLLFEKNKVKKLTKGCTGIGVFETSTLNKTCARENVIRG